MKHVFSLYADSSYFRGPEDVFTFFRIVNKELRRAFSGSGNAVPLEIWYIGDLEELVKTIVPIKDN